jgi:hypothetical protein
VRQRASRETAAGARNSIWPTPPPPRPRRHQLHTFADPDPRLDYSSKMGFLGRLYKAETLDTRFASKTGQKLPNAQPSKWNTPEYWFYFLCLLTIPIFMVKSVYDVSGPWHPSYKQYEHLLEPGWIPGRKVDNSDAQYRSFRDNIPYMALVLILHPILRRVYESLTVSFERHIALCKRLTLVNRTHPQLRHQRQALPQKHARSLAYDSMLASQ